MFLRQTKVKGIHHHGIRLIRNIKGILKVERKGHNRRMRIMKEKKKSLVKTNI